MQDKTDQRTVCTRQARDRDSSQGTGAESLTADKSARNKLFFLIMASTQRFSIIALASARTNALSAIAARLSADSRAVSACATRLATQGYVQGLCARAVFGVMQRERRGGGKRAVHTRTCCKVPPGLVSWRKESRPLGWPVRSTSSCENGRPLTELIPLRKSCSSTKMVRAASKSMCSRSMMQEMHSTCAPPVYLSLCALRAGQQTGVRAPALAWHTDDHRLVCLVLRGPGI